MTVNERTYAPFENNPHSLHSIGAPALFSVAGVTLLLVPFSRSTRTNNKKALPRADVVFSHVPPAGACDRTLNGLSAGSVPLREAVATWARPPALWCFGHIHEGRGAEQVTLRDDEPTLCVNVANANDGKAHHLEPTRPATIVRLEYDERAPPRLSL